MTSSEQEKASIIAVLTAMALVVLDAGLLTVALPSLAQSLDVTPSGAILAVSFYQGALVVGLLPSAHLAERLGYRRLFVGGLTVFSLASLLCAIAPSLPWLVAARVVQGFGGGAIMALGIALLRFALGHGRLGSAIAWNALTVALCAAAAPILGASILSVAPWPWLFLAKLPLCLLALAAARGLPRVEPIRGPIDRSAILLHGASAALIVAAASSLPDRPVAAALFAIAAVASAGVLIKRERSGEAPLWPIDLLALRPFRVAAVASICCFAGQSAGLLGLAFYLHLGSGNDPLTAGLVLACWPLSVAIAAPLASRLAERFGSAALCASGGAILGIGLVLCALWPVPAEIAPLAVGAALAGLGFGLFQVPNNRTLFMTAPLARSAAAGGLQGSARLIGQTVGSLVTALLFACIADVAAPRAGLALAACFATMAAGVSALELPTRSRPARGGAQAPAGN